MSKNNKEVVNKKIAENLVGGKAINLIPPKTEAEVKVETRKVSLNMNAALALLFLFLLSISIVGFNLVSKLDLNRRTEELLAVEQDIRSRGDIISSNDEILRRIKLYMSIEQTTYSADDVLEYWQSVSAGLGEITEINLSQGMNFEVTGTSKNLEDVSKLWYLLGNDEKIETLNLRNVAKDKTFVRFNFEGKLDYEQFERLAATE